MTTHPSKDAHETTDARPGPVAVLGGGLVLLALFVVVLSRGILAVLDARGDRSDAAEPALSWPAEPPPGPRLQADPQADLAAHRATQKARIASYAWVDRDTGLVQVPIERAIELVLERGLPAREPDGEGR